MYRKNDSIIEFKNHNINIKLDWYYKDLFNDDNWGTLNAILTKLDCYIIGEPFSIGNFDAGYMVYNLHSDMCYTLSGQKMADFKEGKSVKLYAYKPNTDDREKNK